jgi:hypothetical protein
MSKIVDDRADRSDHRSQEGSGRNACSGQVPMHGAVILTFTGIVQPFPGKLSDPLTSVFRGN